MEMETVLMEYRNHLNSDIRKSASQRERVVSRLKHTVIKLMGAHHTEDVTDQLFLKGINEMRAKVGKRYAYINEKELNHFFSWVKDTGYLGFNPAIGLTMTVPEPRGVMLFTKEELRRIDQALEILPFGNLFRFAIEEELSSSIICACLISDCDLDNGVILLHRRYVTSSHLGAYELSETKEVIHHLSSASVTLLKEQIAMRKTVNAGEDDVLFTDMAGNAMTPADIRAFNNALKMVSGVNDATLRALISDHKERRISRTGGRS